MSTSLDEYSRKRDFAASPEPRGAARPRQAATDALQYVIQKHAASHLHYDFRLELDGTLKSWAVPKGPCLDPEVKRLAVQVEDPPLDYAGFEGHIPAGQYGAGEVIVWDRGHWKPLDDPRAGYAEGRLRFELQGEKLGGVWNLVRTRMPGKKAQWFLFKAQDAQARPLAEFDVLEARPDSVLSDRSLLAQPRGGRGQAKFGSRQGASVKLSGAVSGPMPDRLAPQLATLVESVPEGDWCYEVKFDGYRILARIRDGEVRLFTRNGHDWTAKLPAHAEALAALGLESAWLDGEIVVENEQGLASFQQLQSAFEQGRAGHVRYYLFDLPYLNGVDLRQVPLEERRAALATVLARGSSRLLRFSEDFREAPDSLLGSVCQRKFEGLVGKRAGSPYVSRRSSDWIKLKCKHRQEFVIVGFTDPQGTRSVLGALLLGLHDPDNGELRYAGKVGTGFSEQSLRTLHERLKSLGSQRPAVVNPPSGFDAKGVHWLRPELVGEVAYAEMTDAGLVRHAVFHGLRADKPAQAIRYERPQPAPGTAEVAREAPKAAVTGQIRITHPDRVIDPSTGISKGELAEYYAQIAPWALPWLKHRPVSLVRGPDGLGGELFFQKHAGRLEMPYMTQLDRRFDPGHAALMVIDSPQALVGAAQMGTLELHSWNAIVPHLEKPDRFVLDLDPDPALPWNFMIEATQLTLTLLDELGLVAFLKTSGGKGIHVVVPLSRRQGWDRVKAFSQAISQHMAAVLPERFTAVSGPRNRIGKIFIDYLRNVRGASTVTAYSARARPGLPVSVPIHRDELRELKGADTWHIRNLPQRLEGLGEDDPWAGLPAVRQSIAAQMRKRLGGKR